MGYFSWDETKNNRLARERGISFEEIALRIELGDLVDILPHPNQIRYPGQKMFVVQREDYIFLVPFVENEEGVFLKTIMPSRKATRHYLGGTDEKTST